ncbi:MAG: LysM peptidoglycan-binding domain-containing protein [Planctomycetota bacterium]|jgi:nucleoid-associated protein YgaU
MTRENKVALVVGFALVLLVGILVSDHLSSARSQEPADLLTSSGRPTSAAPVEPEPIDLQGKNRTAGREPDRLAAPRGPRVSDPALRPAVPPDPVATIRLPNLHEGQPSSAGPVSPGPDAAGGLFHDVRPGESLSSICAKRYGDPALADALARFNGVSDPDVVRAGRRLRVPPAEVLLDGDRGAAAASGGSARPATYTIKPGDSLSEIAQRLLQSADKWRQLYELNRDVISDPDHVQVGTVINLPIGG